MSVFANNIVPTVYEAYRMQSYVKPLKGELRQMKISFEDAKNKLKHSELNAARERRLAAREGYLLGIKTVFPYTVESTYAEDEKKGKIIAARSQTVVGDVLSKRFKVKRPKMFLGVELKKPEKDISQNDVSKKLAGNSSFQLNYEVPKKKIVVSKVSDVTDVPDYVVFKKSTLFGN